MKHPSALGSIDFHPDTSRNQSVLALNLRYLPLVANYMEIILENQARILAHLEDDDAEEVMDEFWNRVRTRWEEEERPRMLSTLEEAQKY